MSTWSAGPLRALACAASILSPAWMPVGSRVAAEASQDAATPVDEHQRKIAELSAAYVAADEAFWAGYQERAAAVKAEPDAAKKKELQSALDAYLREELPGPKFLARFEEAALAAQGSPAALGAWVKVLELDERASEEDVDRPAKRALAALLADFLESEKLGDAVSALQRGVLPHATVAQALRTIRAESPHRKVQGSALLALAGELGGRRATGADKAKSREAYVELARDFADLTDARGRAYGMIAEGFLFDLDHLQVGMLAPDFEAVDENGARFKLSDYRGKVVLLDFWGFW